VINNQNRELRLPHLADDAEFKAAQAAVSAAEASMHEAERRHAAALTPAEDRATWAQVKAARTALDEASERRDEVKSSKSLKLCEALRTEQHRHLRDLLEKLEGAAGALGCLAAIEARIAASGHSIRSDIVGVTLPRATFELGNRDDYGSQLARFRRELRAKGVVE
jgi:hypothetical protein